MTIICMRALTLNVHVDKIQLTLQASIGPQTFRTYMAIWIGRLLSGNTPLCKSNGTFLYVKIFKLDFFKFLEYVGVSNRSVGKHLF